MSLAVTPLQGVLGPRVASAAGERGAARSPPVARPAPWRRGPSNDSVQRVGGGGGLFRAPQFPANQRAAVSSAGAAVQARRGCGTGSAARPAPRAARTMRAAPPPPLLLLLLALLAAPAARASRAQPAAAPPERPPPGPGPANTTRPGAAQAAGGGGSSNSSGSALVTRISSLLRDLPTLKAAVIVTCAFTALLIACLLLRVFRWVRSPLASLPFPRGPTARRPLPRAPRAPPARRCPERAAPSPGPPRRLRALRPPAPYAARGRALAWFSW